MATSRDYFSSFFLSSFFLPFAYLVNFSLFSGKLYFESANSIFAKVTKITPVTYLLTDEIETIQQQLASAEESLNAELTLSKDLKKQIELLSEKVGTEASNIAKNKKIRKLIFSFQTNQIQVLEEGSPWTCESLN